MPKTLLAGWGKSGSCSACSIAVFLLNSLATCNGASGYVMLTPSLLQAAKKMLHAATGLSQLHLNFAVKVTETKIPNQSILEDIAAISGMRNLFIGDNGFHTSINHEENQVKDTGTETKMFTTCWLYCIMGKKRCRFRIWSQPCVVVCCVMLPAWCHFVSVLRNQPASRHPRTQTTAQVRVCYAS